jgi:hypothetical protein
MSVEILLQIVHEALDFRLYLALGLLERLPGSALVVPSQRFAKHGDQRRVARQERASGSAVATEAGIMDGVKTGEGLS